MRRRRLGATFGHLLNLFLAFLGTKRLGDAINAAYRVRLRAETYREPDIAVYLAEHAARFGERYGEGADLVVEVVSGDAASRTRDYEDKRRDYAQAQIPEYWIVDPAEQRITVLVLEGDEYNVLTDGAAGDHVDSRLPHGFRIEVAGVFQAGE
jgi:Uma2 family endonuclease